MRIWYCIKTIASDSVRSQQGCAQHVVLSFSFLQGHGPQVADAEVGRDGRFDTFGRHLRQHLQRLLHSSALKHI